MTIRFMIDGYPGIFNVDTFAVTGRDRRQAAFWQTLLQADLDRRLLLERDYYPSKDPFALDTLAVFQAEIVEVTRPPAPADEVVY